MRLLATRGTVVGLWRAVRLRGAVLLGVETAAVALLPSAAEVALRRVLDWRLRVVVVVGLELL